MKTLELPRMIHCGTKPESYSIPSMASLRQALPHKEGGYTVFFSRHYRGCYLSLSEAGGFCKAVPPIGGVFAQRAHSANYYVVYPGNTP